MRPLAATPRACLGRCCDGLLYSGAMDLTTANACVPDADLATASAAFLPFDGTLYLDCAARGPRLRAVQSAGHAALDADAMPWRAAGDPVEAQLESLRTSVARLLCGGEGGDSV